MSGVWIAPEGSSMPGPDWKPVGVLDSFDGVTFRPDDKVLFVPSDVHRHNTTTATQSFSFTMSPEGVRAFQHFQAKADIIARMRRDLRNQLNAFAKRWGIEYP